MLEVEPPEDTWKDLPQIGSAQLGENCSPECDLCEDNSPLLEIKKLTVAYGRNLALREVDLALPARHLVGLLGPNGAGKSTLLKAILGMISFQGQVMIEGQLLAQTSRHIAYVPQKEQGVRWDFPVTVSDVVMMGRYKHIGWVRRPGKQDHEIVEEALEQVDMADLRKRQISQLSGGQQQRVFVARALAQRGNIILLDEPLTGIDTTSQELIMALLVRLRNEGKLILMATHDLTAAAEVCDTCALVNRRLVAYGPPNQVLQADKLSATFGSKVLTISNGGTTTTVLG